LKTHFFEKNLIQSTVKQFIELKNIFLNNIEFSEKIENAK